MPKNDTGHGSAPQEIEKEVWEKDASGKRKLRLVQEMGYKYEEDMEGTAFASATPQHVMAVISVFPSSWHQLL